MRISPLIVTLFLTHGVSTRSFCAGEKIFIKDFGFDRQSKEFRISYSNPDSNSITTLKDSGALYLCVANHLLKEYYSRMSEPNADENKTKFSQKHLALLSQIAATIPQKEGSQIRDSLRTYIQNFHKGGGQVLKSIRQTIENLLQEHTISMTEEILFSPEHKRHLEREILFVSAQLEGLKKHQDADNPDMKLLLIRSFEGKLVRLRSELTKLPTKSSKKEKKISALETIFCAPPNSKPSLQNPDVGILIDKLSDEVKVALPEAELPKDDSAEAHF